MLGVCYYPEHWPRSMWAEDAAKMRSLGMVYVRIGEFSWSRIEPEEGQYHFEWMDEAIDTLVNEGLKVVIGTPTATPPKWLIDKYREILPVDPDTGNIRGFGSRRHYDFSSEEYLQQSLRITEQMAKRYGAYPGVDGWQVDNELGCHETTLSGSACALQGFRQWCEERYDNISALNQAWGTVFWSMEYRNFSEIELPLSAVTETSPAHRLAYRRFSSDQVVQYHNAMVDVIRRYSPGTFITHNFIPPKDTNVDNFALAELLDFTSYDSYPLGRTDFKFAGANAREVHKYTRTGHPDYATFFHDQVRGLGKGGYWVMEQQPGPVNWAPHNPKPLPGMVRLWSLEAIAHGASCVSYFRWRQVPFAQEQMHAGLLRPDSSPSDAWSEIEQVRKDIESAQLQQLPQSKANIAILLNSEGQWVSDIEQQGAGYEFWDVQFNFYSALRKLGVDIDYISADADFDTYTLIVVPGWPIVSDKLVAKMEGCNAHFVFGPRSGAKTAECGYPKKLPPGGLQKILPFRVLSVETMRPDCPETFQWSGTQYTYRSWFEELDNLGCEAIAETGNGDPLVLKSDRFVYIAALPDDQFLVDYFEQVCKGLGLSVIRTDDDLRINQRGNVKFAFNYSADVKALPIPEDANILVGDSTIEPYGVTIWREL